MQFLFFFLQFFTHPVVDAEMKRKWYGREFARITTERKRWQLLFSIWCLFDMVFCPILFAVFSLKKKQSKNQGRCFIGILYTMHNFRGFHCELSLYNIQPYEFEKPAKYYTFLYEIIKISYLYALLV